MILSIGRKIRLATENMDRRIHNGISAEDAWNQTSIELARCAEAHCRTFIVMRFAESVKNAVSVSKELREVLQHLCELYAVYWVLQRLGDFLQVSTGYKRLIKNFSFLSHIFLFLSTFIVRNSCHFAHSEYFEEVVLNINSEKFKYQGIFNDTIHFFAVFFLG